MLVHKQVIMDGVQYEHYQIKKIEWDLESLIIGVMVIYYDDENKFGSKIKHTILMLETILTLMI